MVRSSNPRPRTVAQQSGASHWVGCIKGNARRHQKDSLVILKHLQRLALPCIVRRHLSGAFATLNAPYASQSDAYFVNGAAWQTGDPVAGSIRLDVIEGPLTNPTHVWDYEFGNATLSQSRITQIQNGIPNGANIPVLEIKP